MLPKIRSDKHRYPVPKFDLNKNDGLVKSRNQLSHIL